MPHKFWNFVCILHQPNILKKKKKKKRKEKKKKRKRHRAPHPMVITIDRILAE
jgi:hypothetical protein